MKKETKKAPIIRFRGFTDDWEQRKLGKLVEFYNGDRSSRYPNDSDMVSEGVPFINAGDLVSGRVKLDTANKITEEKFNELSGAKIQRGDIIYCLRGTLGKNAFVDNFDVGTVASSLVDIRPKKVVGKYLYQVLNSDIEYTQRIVNDEGAAQPNLSAKNLSLFNIPMPDEVEQEKIAAYFDDLDNLITLHQRKLDQLKKLKKYFLQNMFPAKGEKVPRIRFKGFTGDWEQRKLENISAFITKGSTPTTYGYHWVDYGIPFFRNDSIQENTFVYGNYSYISNEANDALKRSEITAKDILIAITGEIGKVGIVPDNIKKANINQHMAKVRISKEAVPYFVYQYLATGKIQNEYQKIKTGLSMPQLSLEQIRNTTILLPCYEEQFKISDYLSGLDNLITLHQRKLNQLQTMKKFMLQNLFI